jgi:hypothetical protein
MHRTRSALALAPTSAPLAVLLVTLVASSLVLVPGLARADALEPPPTDCPEGSVGRTTQRGAFCGLARCEGTCPSAGNGGALVCSPSAIAVCVANESYPAETVQWGPRVRELAAESREVVVGPCASDGSCAAGLTCVRTRACVPEGSASARGGLCAASPGAPRSTGWLVVGLVAVLLAARRRV